MSVEHGGSASLATCIVSLLHVVVQGNTMPARYMQDARERGKVTKLFLTATCSQPAEKTPSDENMRLGEPAWISYRMPTNAAGDRRSSPKFLNNG